MANIKIINDYVGEWIQLFIDDNLEYEGHDIPEHIWIKLLTQFGHNVQSKELKYKICDFCGEKVNELEENNCCKFCGANPFHNDCLYEHQESWHR
jgi:hypothetical protein